MRKSSVTTQGSSVKQKLASKIIRESVKRAEDAWAEVAWAEDPREKDPWAEVS